ncbi:MAG: MFS transporter, partial [Chromatiales bacterium]
YLLRVGVLSDTDARALAPRLAGVPGVAEAVVVAEEGVAYLKVDRRALDVDALGEFSAADA